MITKDKSLAFGSFSIISVGMQEESEKQLNNLFEQTNTGKLTKDVKVIATAIQSENKDSVMLGLVAIPQQITRWKSISHTIDVFCKKNSPATMDILVNLANPNTGYIETALKGLCSATLDKYGNGKGFWSSVADRVKKIKF